MMRPAYAIARWYVVPFVALGSAAIARPENGAAIDPAWLAKARTEGKAVYEKYEALSSQLDEVCEYRFEKVPGSKGTIPLRTHLMRVWTVRLGDNMLFEDTRTAFDASGEPQIRVKCDNPDYNFTLSKLKEDSPCVLMNYAPGKRKQPLIDQGAGLHREVFGILRRALIAIENEHGWTLRALQFDNTKGLLHIDLTSGAGNARTEDQIYVDPSHEWRVVERQFETVSAKGTHRVTYGESVGGVEFPSGSKLSITYKVANAPPNNVITGRLISIKLTDKTPADFRLSAFGLPEPVDAPPLEKPTRWYLWILAAAGVSAALSFGFAYLRRRRQQARRATVQGVSP